MMSSRRQRPLRAEEYSVGIPAQFATGLVGRYLGVRPHDVEDARTTQFHGEHCCPGCSVNVQANGLSCASMLPVPGP